MDKAVIEMIEQIKSKYDPKNYKSKAGAAKALYAVICEISKAYGQNPDIEVYLRNPEQSRDHGYHNNWQVSWESGPYQWGVCLSMSDTGFNREAGWYTEPYYSFDVCFVE